MKLKSGLVSISTSLLVLVMSFSSPTAAQNTDDQQIISQIMAVANTGDASRMSNKNNQKPAKTTAVEERGVDKKAAFIFKDADYWFDKGALCATYGNDRAAINYFQKAITLDPKRSGAYFEQGISYGQLGDFDKAVTLVNQAIEMEPQNGLYLYGRGRIYLLGGKQGQAMDDINKAAELDDEDAQAYLKYIAQQ
ncbi:MAG: tetratricopeptide repeat protein [bacterium]|nr:tetratricopeptide repeat protein [bacterium]